MKKEGKRKAMAALVCGSMLSVALVGGSLAYLTSEDSDVNVMTLGNVEIEQIEQERGANGDLVDFTQAKPAYPAVGPIEWATEGVDVNGTEYKVFTDDLKNVVDKIVTVENTGKSDAYVRTIIAIEAPDYDPNDLIHVNVNGDVKNTAWAPVDIDGVKYVYSVFTYAEALKAGEVSAPSLMQVFLDSEATNEDVAKFGDTWEIKVLSQAVQTEGFGDAKTALDTAFGEATADNTAKWFGDLVTPDVVATADQAYESFSAFDQSGKKGAVVLNGDFNTADADSHWSNNREYALRAAGTDVAFDLNGYTVNHDTVYQDGKNTGYTYLFTTAYNGKLTIDGEGMINSANRAGSCCIIYAQGPSEVVINGGDFKTNKGVAVWAGNNAKVTINGGSFVSTGADEELIYSSGGVIDIYGGFFHNTGWENRPVNVANANRGTGHINIYGGTFVNFDPSTGGDDPDNIKVMDGYKVVSETQANGDVWYSVVPE